MAQKLNSEFNYRTQVIGETPWAKLQTLTGFLIGRKRAAALEEINALRLRAKKEKVKHIRATGGPEYEALELEAEIMEIESSTDDAYNAYRLNEQEIEILERLIAELLVECEKTRIPGYTNEQMFEVNAANEFTLQIVKDIHAEILANGQPSPAKLRNAMSNPITWQAVQQLGLAPKEPLIISYAGGFNETLQIERK